MSVVLKLTKVNHEVTGNDIKKIIYVPFDNIGFFSPSGYRSDDITPITLITLKHNEILGVRGMDGFFVLESADEILKMIEGEGL